MPLKFADAAPEAYRYPLLIKCLLSSVLTTSRHKKIHYRDRSSYTYEEFVGRIGQLASMLGSLGVEQGTTVAVMDWDSPRFLEAYFAVPMMGAVLQTVNIRLSPAQIAYTMEHAGAEVLLVHRDFFPLVESIRDSLPALRTIVAIMDGEGGEIPSWAVGEYEVLQGAAAPDYPFEEFDENAVATTFYTSGTTGNPKGVCYTHRQLVLHTLANCGPFGMSPGATGFGYSDVYMPLTPMFHVHAWGAPYIATMLGVTQIYPGRFDAELICKLRERHRITFSHCVPTVFQMVLDAADRLGSDLDGWKVGIGGSALSRKLYLDGRRRGVALFSGYGMSETAPTVCRARMPVGAGNEEAAVEAMTSSGTPVPLVAVRVVDEEMNDVAQDGASRGELVLRAPWLTPCYVGNAEASRELWRGGWMHTQDIGTLDSNGYLRIRDRLKDVIKSGGEWIDSIMLENLISSVEGVMEASVVAMPHPRWTERPFAFIVAAPGRAPSLEAINVPIEAAIARDELTRYARIDGLEIVEELPRTSVGKIDKKVLRQRFEQAGA